MLGDENYNNVEKSKKTKELKYGNQNYNNIVFCLQHATYRQ